MKGVSASPQAVGVLVCYFSNNDVLLTHVCFVPCCDPSIFRAPITLLVIINNQGYEITLHPGLLSSPGSMQIDSSARSQACREALNGRLRMVEAFALALTCLLQSSPRCVFLLTFNCMTSENLISRKPIYYFNAHLALLFSQSNLFVFESLRRVEKQAKKSVIFSSRPSKGSRNETLEILVSSWMGGGSKEGRGRGKSHWKAFAMVPDGKQSSKLPLNSSVPANRAL